jgi:putative ABC transport system permease protein
MRNYAAFKREIEALPGVRMAATSGYPMYGGLSGSGIRALGRQKDEVAFGMKVDQHFISMMGLKWVGKPGLDMAGGVQLVLNEVAVEKLGLTGDPSGQKLRMGYQDVTVAGVVKNFNYQTLRMPIGAMYLQISPDTASGWKNVLGGCLLAKIGTHVNIPTLMEAIRKVYTRYDRRANFEYSFADEAFDNLYKAEDRLAGLFGMFTLITIIIACLGLFALATFTAQQRVREIGIRKVLGASVASIGVLLTRDFLLPVLIAVVIACPVAWWAMSKWLEDFAYRTTLSWWVFVVCGLGLFLVALATVLGRSLRAGRANPVDNLRAE